MRLPKVALPLALVGLLVAGMRGASTSGDTLEVGRLTHRVKTVCVGRLLIDFPEEAKVELSRQRIDGFDIDVYSETEEEFHARLTARETNLRSKPDRLGGPNSLESVRPVKTNAGLTGKVFVHSRTVTEGTQARGLELERYRYEGVAVESLVHGNGISIDIVADDYDPAHVESLAKLVAQIVPNPDNQIPVGPGYCIDRAFVRDPLDPAQGEQLMMSVALPSRPDVAFKLILAAGVTPADQSLLERADAADMGSIIPHGRAARLRGESRSVAGLKGEELVERFVENNGAVVYSFWWEVDGTPDNVYIPHVVFEMDTGTSAHRPVSSSLSEGAAIGLWETVMSSIRVRPAELPKRAEIARQLALGTHAAAGEICPQNGWWHCRRSGRRK